MFLIGDKRLWLFQELEEERLIPGDHQPYRWLEIGDGHLAVAQLPDGWNQADFFANDNSVLPKPKRDAGGKVIEN